MSFEVIGELNWLAVIVGAVLYFAVGALWYSPVLFARPWQASIGWGPERGAPEANAATYAVPGVAYLVAAVATGMVATATGSAELVDGIVLGLVLGIGFAVTLTTVEAVFDPNKPKPWTWWAITAPYHLIGIVIVAVLVSIWR